MIDKQQYRTLFHTTPRLWYAAHPSLPIIINYSTIILSSLGLFSCWRFCFLSFGNFRHMLPYLVRADAYPLPLSSPLPPSTYFISYDILRFDILPPWRHRDSYCRTYPYMANASYQYSSIPLNTSQYHSSRTELPSARWSSIDFLYVCVCKSQVCPVLPCLALPCIAFLHSRLGRKT